MRLMIVEKAALTAEQSEYLQQRLALEEHRDDGGPMKVWNVYTGGGLFAFIELSSGLPIAIAEASGLDCARPCWWIDRNYRGQGYGSELVDLLATELKARGVRHVGPIPIQTHQGVYDAQSTKLKQRFCRHFEEAGASLCTPFIGMGTPWTEEEEADLRAILNEYPPEPQKP